MISRILIVSIIIFSLSACATTKTELPPVNNTKTEDVLVCRVPLEVDHPAPIQWRDFDWKVLNREIVESMLEKDEEVYYFALTYDDYKNLSLTVKDILRYTKLQRTTIDEMDSYYSNRDDHSTIYREVDSKEDE